MLTRGESSRETKNADDPDVVWEGEFPDEASLKRYEEIADKHPDFIAARQKMSTVTRKPAERRYISFISAAEVCGTSSALAQPRFARR